LTYGQEYDIVFSVKIKKVLKIIILDENENVNTTIENIVYKKIFKIILKKKHKTFYNK